MASKFTGFLDNVASGILGPKGNMADWQHAARLYTDDTQKHAPKLGFLYHVTFTLTKEAQAICMGAYSAAPLIIDDKILARFRAAVVQAYQPVAYEIYGRNGQEECMSQFRLIRDKYSALTVADYEEYKIPEYKGYIVRKKGTFWNGNMSIKNFAFTHDDLGVIVDW